MRGREDICVYVHTKVKISVPVCEDVKISVYLYTKVKISVPVYKDVKISIRTYSVY